MKSRYYVGEEEYDFAGTWQREISRTWSLFLLRFPLGVWNEGANVSKPHDDKGYCLDEKVNEEVIFAKENIITATEEKVNSNPKLQQMKPAVKIYKYKSSKTDVKT